MGRFAKELITALGETKTLPEWAEDPRVTVKYAKLRRRIFAARESNSWWTTEALLFSPDSISKENVLQTELHYPNPANQHLQWIKSDRRRATLEPSSDPIGPVVW